MGKDEAQDKSDTDSLVSVFFQRFIRGLFSKFSKDFLAESETISIDIDFAEVLDETPEIATILLTDYNAFQKSIDSITKREILKRLASQKAAETVKGQGLEMQTRFMKLVPVFSNFLCLPCSHDPEMKKFLLDEKKCIMEGVNNALVLQVNQPEFYVAIQKYTHTEGSRCESQVFEKKISLWDVLRNMMDESQSFQQRVSHTRRCPQCKELCLKSEGLCQYRKCQMIKVLLPLQTPSSSAKTSRFRIMVIWLDSENVGKVAQGSTISLILMVSSGLLFSRSSETKKFACFSDICIAINIRESKLGLYLKNLLRFKYFAKVKGCLNEEKEEEEFCGTPSLNRSFYEPKRCKNTTESRKKSQLKSREGSEKCFERVFASANPVEIEAFQNAVSDLHKITQKMFDSDCFFPLLLGFSCLLTWRRRAAANFTSSFSEIDSWVKDPSFNMAILCDNELAVLDLIQTQISSTCIRLIDLPFTEDEEHLNNLLITFSTESIIIVRHFFSMSLKKQRKIEFIVSNKGLYHEGVRISFTSSFVFIHEVCELDRPTYFQSNEKKNDVVSGRTCKKLSNFHSSIFLDEIDMAVDLSLENNQSKGVVSSYEKDYAVSLLSLATQGHNEEDFDFPSQFSVGRISEVINGGNRRRVGLASSCLQNTFADPRAKESSIVERRIQGGFILEQMNRKTCGKGKMEQLQKLAHLEEKEFPLVAERLKRLFMTFSLSKILNIKSLKSVQKTMMSLSLLRQISSGNERIADYLLAPRNFLNTNAEQGDLIMALCCLEETKITKYGPFVGGIFGGGFSKTLHLSQGQVKESKEFIGRLIERMQEVGRNGISNMGSAEYQEENPRLVNTEC